MATYNLTGARFLRMFTADKPTPTYAAETDAANIVDRLCDVPWARVVAKDATMTSHSSEKSTRGTVEKTGLDWNVDDREYFDAAVWCSNHTGGNHTAYANAACYVFALPTMASYPNLTALKVKATSDPYNVSGLRIAVKTSDTLTIPTTCSVCREGDFYASSVAPHRTVTDSSGNVTWYPKTEDKTLTPSTTVALKKYLFVFVLKESYGETRGNWLEGSGFIKNAVEITTSAAITGWTDGDTEDCTEVEDPVEFVVCKDGILPDTDGASSALVYVNCLASGTVPVQDSSKYVTNIAQVNDELSPANSFMGIRTAFAKLANGAADVGAAALCHVNNKRLGAGFCIRQGADIPLRESASGTAVNPRAIALTAASLCIPFSLPATFAPRKLRLDKPAWKVKSVSGRLYGVCYGGGRFIFGNSSSGESKYALVDGKTSLDAMSSLTGMGESAAVYGNGRLVYGAYAIADGSDTSTALSGTCGVFTAYGDGRFVSIDMSEHKTYALADGSNTWVEIGAFPSSAGYAGIAYGNGRFVALDNAGKSFTMADGVTTWTEIGETNLGGGSYYMPIAYGNGRFVACDINSNHCAILEDGATEWSDPISIELPSNTAIVYLVYADGFFVGATGSTSVNALYMPDGETAWTRFDNFGSNMYVQGLATGNGRVVAAVSDTGGSRYIAELGFAGRYNVWLADGYVASVGESVLKNKSLYYADAATVGDWTLLGTFDGATNSATFDLPDLSSKNATILVTAFIDPEEVANSTGGFGYGTATFWYNGMSADTDVTSSSVVTRLFGSDSLMVPDVTLVA